MIVDGALWCGPFNDLTDVITGSNFSGTNTAGISLAKTFAPQGVVFAVVISDGPVVGTGATSADMTQWISGHDVQGVFVWPDPGNANLGIFFNAAAIPLDMFIDLRSMALLQADVGFNIDLGSTVTSWLKWIATHPAGTQP